jgi:hypothetical protein
LSNPLKKEFNIEPDEIVIENRYKPYLKQLGGYKNYINTPAFKAHPHFRRWILQGTRQQSISYIPKIPAITIPENTHISGLRHYPAQATEGITKNHVKLFFIYHKDDGEFIKDTFEVHHQRLAQRGEQVSEHTKNLQVHQPTPEHCQRQADCI